MSGSFDDISLGLMAEVASTDEIFRAVAKKMEDKEAMIYLHWMAHQKEMEYGNKIAMKAFRQRRSELS